MVVEVFFDSVFAFLKGSLFFSLPVFLLVLIGRFAKNKVNEAGIKNWFYSSFFATNIVLFVLLFLAYFFPVILSLQEQEIGVVPSTIAPTPLEILGGFLFGVVKVILATLVVSAILMPFELIGSYVNAKVVMSFPKLNEHIRLYITCLICTALGSLVILFLIPELPTGLIYFLYFG